MRYENVTEHEARDINGGGDHCTGKGVSTPLSYLACELVYHFWMGV